ncbi:anti-sigma factor [Pseudonocardia sp.]|uniref:anti-sigma factor n=1 Tax=Pseudonocardia sp. TaxID=60912 RepID=UPI00263364E4|nr:anti-sigma factor [Pseudonocardia sp.]
MNLDDRADLGAHALGLLTGDDARAVQHLLDTDADARREWEALHATATTLRQVPPEMFLDGPPESDLLVRRAVRTVRADGSGARRRRRFALVAAAVVAVAALLGGGAVLGRALLPEPAAVVAAGTRTVQGAQGPVTMTATITPAAGWVRVATAVRGVEPGRECTIVVLDGDGAEHVAGSWVIGSGGGGAPIEGATIVDPADVVAVAIRDETGTDLITLPV